MLIAVAVSSCSGGEADPKSDSIIPGSVSRLTSTLSAMEGKPVVVNYWATWCAPCKAEMPRIVAAAKKYGKLVGFLGVDVQDDGDAAAKFVKHYKMPFRSLSDPDRKIANGQRIAGLPVTQFYARDGSLAFVHQGEIKSDDLKERIDELLSAKTED